MTSFGTVNRFHRDRSVTFWLVLSLAISAGLSTQAGAHSGDRMYPIPELTDAMLEKIQLGDGSVDEWYDLLGEPVLTLLDFKAPYSKLGPDPSNLDFRIWMAWHDDPDRLYLAFASSDDEYKNTHEYNSDGSAEMSSHDSITLGIDGDHSGGGGGGNNISREEWATIWGGTQLYDAIAGTVSGPTLDESSFVIAAGDIRGANNSAGKILAAEFPWSVLPPYGDAGGVFAGERPTVSVIELYVSPYDRWEGWDSLPEQTVFSDLAAGKVIGFAFIVFDRDEDESEIWTPEGIQTEDPETDIGFLRADLFLDGLLLPAEPEASAVESVSWGRIKAALKK